MKIRTGFVSNSSSSSFIVVFPKDKYSFEEFSKLLDPYENGLIDDYYIDDLGEDEENYMDRLYSDFLNTNIATISEIQEEFSDMLRWNYRDPKALKNAAKKQTEMFLEMAKTGCNNPVIKIFTYSDENGEGYLEHSNVFRNLIYQHISKH